NQIRICNRGKIAMKAVARVPPPVRGCASFSPDMGFVQPGSFFEFGLRFRPDPECLARCAREGWGVGGAGMIAIPMRVDVPGQALPARLVLKARGGRAGAAVVSFGPCFVGQSVVRRVSLRSTSLLPAKFGFVGHLTEVRTQ
ncbi:unnamed protein product, partial [Laminaria digitata]